MSDIRAIMENCKAIRERLRNPPNAVPDTGINLRRNREPAPQIAEPEILVPLLLVVPNVIPLPVFRRTDLTFANTLAFVADEFNISGADIRLRCRKPLYAVPRQIAVYLTAKLTDRSLFSMGRYLGMDHTTMLHARKKVRRMVRESMLCEQYIYSLEIKLLAAFRKPALSDISKPYLGPEETQGNAEVGRISTVDN